MSRNLVILQEEQQLPHPADDFWYGGSNAGVRQSAQCEGVYACVSLIADVMASLPLKLYRALDRGSEPATEHPAYYIVHTCPEGRYGETTPGEWIRSIAWDLETVGNHYAKYSLDSKGNIEWVRRIVPDQVTDVKRDDETGVKVYFVREKSGVTPYTDSEIFHVPGYSYDGVTGYSPISLHRIAIEESRSAEIYSALFFKNNAAPRTYLSYPAKLGKDAYDRLMAWFQKKWGGLANSHKLGIIEEGGKIEVVPVNHRDIQFLELRKYSVERIARIYRVPLHLIQSMDRATFNNIEHQSIDFVRWKIAPLAKLLEDRLNLILLGPNERGKYFFKFSLNGLLRGDSAARSAFYSSAIQNAYMTPNEIRELEELNPIDGGDQLFIQSGTIPISEAGRDDTPERLESAMENQTSVMAEILARPMPEPKVIVNMPELPKLGRRVVERDSEGRIIGVREE
jgi:HK97 family phage portal protein